MIINLPLSLKWVCAVELKRFKRFILIEKFSATHLFVCYGLLLDCKQVTIIILSFATFAAAVAVCEEKKGKNFNLFALIINTSLRSTTSQCLHFFHLGGIPMFRLASYRMY